VPPDATEATVSAPQPSFTTVQEADFSASGAQPNAFVDFDNDGDLDLFIGFRGRANRLYRNDAGVYTDVAAQVGLALEEDTRVASWGDYDGDGDADVYIGFPTSVDAPDRLYRNDGADGFTEVSASVGLEVRGTTRQTSWLDLDGDNDLDLFVALRDGANRMFRNDSGRFVDITERTGLGDARKTVGVAWFDYDQDGDLDAFVANQNGDQDGFFRNDGGRFTDIAAELGMIWPDRTDEYGGVGPAVSDYDNDGDLDLFVANYGPDALWRNEGDGTFTEVAGGTPVGADHHSTTAAWGDVDNDGFEDVYVAAFLGDEPEAPDHLFVNVAGELAEAIPDALLARGASHGVRFADYDQDGDLDLALANNNAASGHWLYRNELDAAARGRALVVEVAGASGGLAPPGTEVRAYSEDGRLLATRMVDTGGGYCSQGVAPLFFAFAPGVARVRLEVTVPSGGVRQVSDGGTHDLGGGTVVRVGAG